MGNRDYRHREAKKPKKDAKKAPPVQQLRPVVNPEVPVVRKRKPKEEEEEEE